MLELILCIATFFISVGVTWRVRHYAITRQMMDIPNERSSHTIPTPRGGGMGIVVAFLLALLAFGALSILSWSVVIALVGGGLITAIVGYVDDRGHVSPLWRALVHFAAAAWILVWLGGMPPLDLGFTVIEWGVIGHLVGWIGIVWLINLYNFMDGIDGLSGGEAVFVALAAGFILAISEQIAYSWLAFGLASACMGFLVWNWPPAKIFMGDVGSGFLGAIIAGIAILSTQSLPVMAWVWLILLAVFIIDATFTLVRRVLRGEKWYSAHRSHAYQHLTQRWQSHLRVTIAILLFNIFWLLPLAFLAWAQPTLSLLATLLGFLPLLVLAWRLKAGTSQLATS